MTVEEIQQRALEGCDNPAHHALTKRDAYVVADLMAAGLTYWQAWRVIGLMQRGETDEIPLSYAVASIPSVPP